MSRKKRSGSQKPEIFRRETVGSITTDVSIGNITVSANANKIAIGHRSTLREWWFELQRRFHGYSCYGIFLLLPSDKEASRYLHDFGIELDTISRNNCLIIFLGNGNFKRPNINSNDWQSTIKRHISLGGSARIAQIFEVEYDKFPCLLLFEDIRSDKHIVVSLREMTAEEMAQKLRTIFSVIQKSIADKQDPLQALEKNRNNENLQRVGKSVISEVHKFTGKTMEVIMETWVKSTIK
jgi:hypothetical protein